VLEKADTAQFPNGEKESAPAQHRQVRVDVGEEKTFQGQGSCSVGHLRKIGVAKLSKELSTELPDLSNSKNSIESALVCGTSG